MRYFNTICITGWLAVVSLCSLSTMNSAIAEETDLSLESILNLTISTASKKSESLFTSPLSSSVLTRHEIENSGALTIPELLRLVPGVIVRQETNGNWNVFIRGLDVLPIPKLANGTPPVLFGISKLFSRGNSYMLVMIDGRVVYNYYSGITLWETLPIGVHDIEQIEVVRGPMAALYGPNAVAGVINLITRKPTKEGPSAFAVAMYGTKNSGRGEASVSYNQPNDWNVTLSANYARMDRFQTEYYDEATGTYVPHTELNHPVPYIAFNPEHRFEDVEKSLDKWGINLFADKTVGDWKLNLQGGHQNSWAQALNDFPGANLVPRTSNTRYGNLKLTWQDRLTFNASMVWGSQEYKGVESYPFTGVPNVPTLVPAVPNFDADPLTNSELTFGVFDASVEYDLPIGPAFSLRPGLAARRVEYTGLYLGGSRFISDVGASLRAEYNANGWRFIGAVRNDKYSAPDRSYQAYSFVALRELNQNHLIRAVYGRANKFPTMQDVYNFSDEAIQIPIVNTPLSLVTASHYRGKPDLELMTNDMFELGYRWKISPAHTLDSEFWYTQAKDIPGTFIVGSDQANAVVQTLPMNDARQYGATVSLSHVIGSLTLREFATLQYSSFADIYVNRDEFLKDTYSPLLYAGANGTYRFNDRFSLTVNPYLLSAQQTTVGAGPGANIVNEDIPMKLIVNATAGYDVTKAVNVFVTARNLAGSDAREYSISDRAGSLYLVGLRGSF